MLSMYTHELTHSRIPSLSSLTGRAVGFVPGQCLVPGDGMAWHLPMSQVGYEFMADLFPHASLTSQLC